MRLWTCPDPACHATNAATAKVCEACGGERGAAASAPVSAPRVCAIDSAPLNRFGFCEAGRGYPQTFGASPFACPDCRQPLAWSGACYLCRGGATLEAWRYPGDRYEIRAGHYVLAQPGPQPVTSRAQTVALIRVVAMVHEQGLTVEAGQERVWAILGEGTR